MTTPDPGIEYTEIEGQSIDLTDLPVNGTEGEHTADPALSNEEAQKRRVATMRAEADQLSAENQTLRYELIQVEVSRAGVNPRSKLGKTIIETAPKKLLDSYVGSADQWRQLRHHVADYLPEDAVNRLGIADPDDDEYWSQGRR